MRADLDKIISASSETLRPLIEKAFELGYDAAVAEMKTKLADLTPLNPNEESSGRAKSGSVKPAIRQMIVETNVGLTLDEIVKATGFKPNSVRGTLWTLSREGLAVKHKNRWSCPKRPQEIH
jgi:hypothetical protein